jgi:hypothetical protein
MHKALGLTHSIAKKKKKKLKQPENVSRDVHRPPGPPRNIFAFIHRDIV